jgi:trehalose-phosphatase
VGDEGATPATGLPSALAAADAIWACLTGRRVMLFLDYDGTLTPIVERPEDAVLSPAMREVVRALARRCPVAIVSGRDREAVERLVGVEGLAYVGSHGFDIAGPPGSGIRREVATAHLPDLDRAERMLRARLADVEGAQVERKRFAVAVHLRRVAPSLHGRVERDVDAVLASNRRLRRTEGKAVLELRPDLDWDKGRAALWLLEALGLDDGLPIHVGDDLTDESAFEALAGRGIGILVGTPRRPSAAAFALGDPGEVERFLRGLADVLGGREE